MRCFIFSKILIASDLSETKRILMFVEVLKDSFGVFEGCGVQIFTLNNCLMVDWSCKRQLFVSSAWNKTGSAIY